MAFVKLDTGILNSTLWVERECRDLFITALLMAEPFEVETPMQQFEVHSLNTTGFIVPIGWYGLVRAAGVGICRMAMVDPKDGLPALERLGAPDPESRSKDFDGRRLIRVDGGFVVLNYMKYRERDYTTAERSRRYRERIASRRGVTVSRRDITQAEVEAEVDKEEKTKPKTGRAIALPNWLPSEPWDAWLETRKKMRAPNTERALKLAIGDLEKLRSEGQDPGSVLDQSTKRGWRGLFPISTSTGVPDYSGVAANIKD